MKEEERRKKKEERRKESKEKKKKIIHMKRRGTRKEDEIRERRNKSLSVFVICCEIGKRQSVHSIVRSRSIDRTECKISTFIQCHSTASSTFYSTYSSTAYCVVGILIEVHSTFLVRTVAGTYTVRSVYNSFSTYSEHVHRTYLMYCW